VFKVLKGKTSMLLGRSVENPYILNSLSFSGKCLDQNETILIMLKQ
jgi:hypothetical protein